MATPIIICLELLAPLADEPYVRCTARPGRKAGLAIGEDGSILWRHPGPVACEVWVSADQRLIAYRRAGAPAVALHRAHRGLELPFEKPVVMRHHDELVVNDVRYRVHVHGQTTELRPPERLRLRRSAAAVAAVMAVGAVAVTACGETDSDVASPQLPGIQVPRVPAQPQVDSGHTIELPDVGLGPEDAGDAAIEVREDPPIPE